MVNQQELEGLIAQALDEAKQRGASAAEAGLSSDAGLSVSVRMGEVETIEHTRDKGLGVTVYFGQKKGSSSTTDFSHQAIRETVQAACDIARYTEEDDCAGLADADLMATTIPDLQLYHPWELSAESAIKMAMECEQSALDLDARINNSEGASISTNTGCRVYGNSHGFVGGYQSSRHSISCSVIGQGEQGMQRDYWYSAARDASDMDSAQSVGAEAARRTLRRLDAKSIATQNLPILFVPELAAGIWGSFIGAISGGALYRKASFLLDSLGQQVLPEFVQLQERPHILKGLGSVAFDQEGVATRERTIVADGVVEGYVLSSYSARKLGMQTTANAGGVHNLVVSSGDKDFSALLKEMDRGVVVTEMLGQGVNRVTGDYSRGAAGFWVESGEIQYPIEEFTVAGNLREMFRNLVAVGNDVDARRNIQTGSLLIEGMTIAGEA